MSNEWLNKAIECVMDLIDARGNFALITRGALGTGNGLSCEIAPSNAEAVFMDKGVYFPVTLAINGKHTDLETLTETLNGIMDNLTTLTTYPTGAGFEIVDITNGIMPHVIGRQDNNAWLCACDIVVKIYRKEETPNES